MTQAKAVEPTPSFDARPSFHINCYLAPSKGNNTSFALVASRKPVLPFRFGLCRLELDLCNCIALFHPNPTAVPCYNTRINPV